MACFCGSGAHVRKMLRNAAWRTMEEISSCFSQYLEKLVRFVRQVDKWLHGTLNHMNRPISSVQMCRRCVHHRLSLYDMYCQLCEACGACVSGIGCILFGPLNPHVVGWMWVEINEILVEGVAQWWWWEWHIYGMGAPLNCQHLNTWVWCHFSVWVHPVNTVFNKPRKLDGTAVNSAWTTGIHS